MLAVLCLSDRSSGSSPGLPRSSVRRRGPPNAHFAEVKYAKRSTLGAGPPGRRLFSAPARS